MKVRAESMFIVFVFFGGMVNAMNVVKLEDNKQNLEQSLASLEVERCLLEGKLYFYGEGTVERDYERAFDCFNKVVDQGADFMLKKESSYFLGLMYAKGLGVKKDAQKAKLYLNKINRQELVQKIREIAQRLDFQVDFEMGVVFHLDKDFERAREYYEKAAEQDVDTGAQVAAWNGLGNLYRYGQGVAQDYGQAREYYEKAAKQEVSKDVQALAWIYLGSLYRDGKGEAQDYVKAREYYEKAAGQDAIKWAKESALKFLKDLDDK